MNVSKSKSNLNTPIGRVRTVMIGKTRYFMIKDVCAGIGLQGHSPWSWHVNAGNNRERFYKRYDLNRRRETKFASAKDTVTVITLEGLYDYLRSPYIIKKPRAMMFKTWLDAYTPLKEVTVTEATEPERLDEMIEQAAEQATPEQEAKTGPKQYWEVNFRCRKCGFTTIAPTKFCPDCGEPLAIPSTIKGAST